MYEAPILDSPFSSPLECRLKRCCNHGVCLKNNDYIETCDCDDGFAGEYC